MEIRTFQRERFTKLSQRDFNEDTKKMQRFFAHILLRIDCL